MQQHYLIYRNILFILFYLFIYFLVKAKNGFINDFMTLHKPLLQFAFDTGITTLHKKKLWLRFILKKKKKRICILDNRNIQITVTDGEKNWENRLNWDNIWFFPIFCHGILPYSVFMLFYLVYCVSLRFLFLRPALLV